MSTWLPADNLPGSWPTFWNTTRITDLHPYWTSWQAMLTWFRNDLLSATQICSATDTAVSQWAAQRLGMGTTQAQQYAAITALALRQAYGGTGC